MFLKKRYFSVCNINKKLATLELATGQIIHGKSFGAQKPVSGEIVFTTSLVGYPESMTDPSYRGQILVFTQPLIGNYGVPPMTLDRFGLPAYFESSRIQPLGIVVSEYCKKYSHWNAVKSLQEWCVEEDIPALCDVDTRYLVKQLSTNGSTLARIYFNGQDGSIIPFNDPNKENLVSQVSTDRVKVYNKGGHVKIGIIDTGAKTNIIRQLCVRGAEVHVLPFNYDPSADASFDGFFISNGPGSPEMCMETVGVIRKTLKQDVPVYGICMGNLLLGIAAGFSVKKLPFGNRAHNQPVRNLETGECMMSSQNHGYALDDSLSNIPPGWKTFYTNIHDNSNEGIMHETLPFKSVQFHPEAKGGPEDTLAFFDDFMQAVESALPKEKANFPLKL